MQPGPPGERHRQDFVRKAWDGAAAALRSGDEAGLRWLVCLSVPRGATILAAVANKSGSGPAPGVIDSLANRPAAGKLGTGASVHVPFS